MPLGSCGDKNKSEEYSATSPSVSVSNPKTIGFEIVRTTLIPGILKTLANNKFLGQC